MLLVEGLIIATSVILLAGSRRGKITGTQHNMEREKVCEGRMRIRRGVLLFFIGKSSLLVLNLLLL